MLTRSAGDESSQAAPWLLRYLADLAPTGSTTAGMDVTTAGFAWLGTQGISSQNEVGPSGDPFPSGHVPQHGHPIGGMGTSIGSSWANASEVPGLRQLAELDALHASERLLRLGWAFLAGSVTVDGRVRGYCRPLLSMPVAVRPRLLSRVGVQSLGPWDLGVGIEGDDNAATALELGRQFGGGAFPARAPTAELLRQLPQLTQWIGAVVRAAGLPSLPVVGEGPPEPTGSLRVVVGYGIFAARDAESIDLRSCLTSWSGVSGIERTALWACVAGGTGAIGSTESGDGSQPLVSPLELTIAQSEVIRRARREAVTVVSGPPGSGKSHASVAIALDAVARGQSVLLATRSAQAADVLAGLLEQRPGPSPVLFGGGERAGRLATVLADGIQQAGAPAPGWVSSAASELDVLSRTVDAVLAGVLADQEWRRSAPLIPAHRASAPGLFAATADLHAIDMALAQAARTGGLFAGWRRNQARKRLARLAGVAPSTPLAEVAESLRLARVAAAAAAAVAYPGVHPDLWTSVDLAEGRARDALGVTLDVAVRNRLTANDRQAVAALATALRAGRATRRRHLRAVDAPSLTNALPLWIGTLGDIEELLPQQAAMFDLVVLDEASQIDLVSAAPALLRGARCVVVGDPRQLRFVSFLSDDRVTDSLSRHGLAGWSGRLDARRVSAYDLAASSAPVSFLDEHFRSVPHLIGFAAERFYEGRLTVATCRPDNETADRIEVRRIAGRREADGVNQAEVDAVVEEVAALLPSGASIGLVTPFRPQADAIERAVLDRFDLEALRASELRVGTVHAFQGDERDVMVLSLALDAEGKGQRFLEDPNLFNVLVTRAKQRMVVITSTDDLGRGLLADFLTWGERPPRAVSGGRSADWWTEAVATALEGGGTAVRRSYPVGRQRVDLCVGTGSEAIGVETAVHAEGFAAHRSRHLQLRRAGWTLVDAFPVRFDADPVAAAVHLAAIVASRQ